MFTEKAVAESSNIQMARCLKRESGASRLQSQRRKDAALAVKPKIAKEKKKAKGSKSKNSTKGKKQKTRYPKRSWTPEEDEKLRHLVKDVVKDTNWSYVACQFDRRQGKQCRERWYNHLDPKIKKAPWSQEELDQLFRLHGKYGNKWSLIAKEMKGRTDNNIKNTWNTKYWENYPPIEKCEDLSSGTHDYPNQRDPLINYQVCGSPPRPSLCKIQSFNSDFPGSFPDSPNSRIRSALFYYKGEPRFRPCLNRYSDLQCMISEISSFDDKVFYRLPIFNKKVKQAGDCFSSFEEIGQKQTFQKSTTAELI